MNIYEALESGKRYNRAIRQNHWYKGVYLYDKEGIMYLAAPSGQRAGKPFEFTTECLAGNDWEITKEAPWSGPAGVITVERAREMAMVAYDNSECSQQWGCIEPSLQEAIAQVIMTLGNSSIAFVEQPQEQSSV